MQHAIRSQADGKNLEYSARAALDTSGWEDTARQEFKNEADVNVMLSRFGVIPPLKPLQWGVVDYEIDLQTALGAIEQAKRAHARLPATVKADYPSWQSLLNAIEAGELNLKEGDRPTDPPATPAPPVSP